jgi:hypothetical protein
MGSVGLGNTANLGAFNNRIFPEGLDLGRCQIKEALGVYVADPANTFRAGMIVMQNASGLVVPSDGVNLLGVAKWNHTTSMYAAVVDEPVVLNGTTASNLKHALVSNVRVSSAVAGGGTTYTVTTDYTVNATNGTVTRAGGGAIGDGDTVYVSYTFQIPESDLLQLQGKNFWNTTDEVSQADGRVTVITDAELLFTTQYDTSKVYAVTGATSNLYASTAQPGLFTTDTAGSAKFVGRVFQVPTAADPFLGLRFVKTPLIGT